MSSKTVVDAIARQKTAKPWSLAGRLAVAFGVAAFALLLAAIAFPYFALAINLDREDNESLTEKVAVIDAVSRKSPSNATELRDDLRQEAELQVSSPVLVRVVGDNGQTLAESRGMANVLPTTAFPQPTTFRVDPNRFVDMTLPDDRAFRVFSARIAAPANGQHSLWVQVGLDRSAEARLLTNYRRGLVVELTLGLVACAVAGYAVARRGLRPIEHMAETVRQIGSATLNERIEPGGFPAELSTLASAFNTMLQRLEDAFTRLSRFSADIAHELRTPINNVRGLVEVSLGTTSPSGERNKLLAASLDECQRLSRLIDNLLFLARAENPQTQINRQSIDVVGELTKMQEFYEAVGGEAGVTIELDTTQVVHAELDRLLVQRAVGNLIENAFAHTPAGGTIRLNAARREDQVLIAVTDTGHGIPAEHLSHLFERFHRVDPSRSKNTGGLGLGLAIVSSIAALHGGTVEVTSQLGSGSCFTLLLPDRSDEIMTPVS